MKKLFEILGADQESPSIPFLMFSFVAGILLSTLLFLLFGTGSREAILALFNL